MKKCIKKLFNTQHFNSMPVLLFCLSFICCVCALFSVSSASAFELNEGSALVLIDGHIETSQGRVDAGISGSDLIFPIPNYDTTVNGLYFEFNTSSGLTPDFMFTFNIRYQAESGQNGWLQLDSVLGQNMDIITLDCVNAHNNTISTSGTTLHVGTQTITCSYLAISHGNYNNFESRLNSRIATFMQPVPDSSRMIVTPGFVRHFNTNGLTENDRDWLESVLENSSTDVSSVVSTINSQTTTLNSSINSLRSDTQAQTDAIEQGNDDAQSRWEADKEEEAEREEANTGKANQALSVFSFNLANPFEPFLNLFRADNCVTIATIASMVHYQNTDPSYCGGRPYDVGVWFPGQIRDILTPVFNVSSLMLLFGFVIRWLSDTEAVAGFDSDGAFGIKTGGF